METYFSMKVIIAGGRYFTDYELLRDRCDYYLKNSNDIEIVSGRCSVGVFTFHAADGTRVFGADGLGEKYAEERGYPVKPFPADWSLGKVAGRVRNAKMAFYCTPPNDALIAFWDGVSTGTKNMIDLATERGLKVKTIKL